VGAGFDGVGSIVVDGDGFRVGGGVGGASVTVGSPEQAHSTRISAVAMLGSLMRED
jgi:hypothetical protein